MRDIVERLEEYDPWRPERDCKDAATEILRLRAENERLRAALKPFAEHALLSYFEASDDDETVNPEPKDKHHQYTHYLLVGDIRRAARALQAQEDGNE